VLDRAFATLLHARCFCAESSKRVKIHPQEARLAIIDAHRGKRVERLGDHVARWEKQASRVSLEDTEHRWKVKPTSRQHLGSVIPIRFVRGFFPFLGLNRARLHSRAFSRRVAPIRFSVRLLRETGFRYLYPRQ